MVELTELDGVADGRASNLKEAGYESVEDLAEADPEVVADEVSYVPNDTALDLVVQSQNLVEEQDAEVEESEPVTKEVADAVESADEPDSASENDAVESVDDSENSDDEEPEQLPEAEELDEELAELEEEMEEESEPDESGEPESDLIEFSLSFDNGLQFDTFFDAVMGQRSKMLRSNRDGVDVFDHALEQMRDGGLDEAIELSMDEGQLNDLHNSVRQTMIDYKGDNLIDHMDALKAVLNDINEVRDEHLF